MTHGDGEDSAHPLEGGEDEQMEPQLEGTDPAPPEAEGLERTTTSDKISKMFAAVPEIGAGRRWYDYPYRALQWMSLGWRRQLLPRGIVDGIFYVLNFLIPFNEYDRHRVAPLDDPLDNLLVPSSEHVSVAGLWAVELVPPSMANAVEDALKKSGLGKRRDILGMSDSNASVLREARSTRGGMWWRLGEVTTPESPYWFPDASREPLPSPFSAVELVAVQVGSSVTAIVAFFHLTDEAMSSLDRVWHAKHEPRITFRGVRRPEVDDRLFSGLKAVQGKRESLHATARRWLAKECPGAFAAGQEHPVVDLLLFDEFDPVTRPVGRAMSNPLRALGLDGDFYHHYHSPDLPALTLLPWLRSDIRARATSWALTGQTAEAVSAQARRREYSATRSDARFLARVSDDAVREFLLLISVSAYSGMMHRRLSAARDEASPLHGRFRLRAIAELRKRILKDSLDLASVARDSKHVWLRRHREFTRESSPTARSQDIPAFAARNYVKDLQEQRTEEFAALSKEERHYREVLATAANLGATIEATRLGRRALFASIVSLSVALIAVLLSSPQPESLWAGLWAWISALT